MITSFLIIIFIFSAFICLKFSPSRFKSRDVLQPGFVYISLLSLYSISFIARAENLGNYDLYIIYEFVYSYIIGIIFFLIGYLLINSPKRLLSFLNENLLIIDLRNKGFLKFIFFISIFLIIFSLPQLIKYLAFSPESYVETALRDRVQNYTSFSPIKSVLIGFTFPLLSALLIYKPNNIFKQIPIIVQQILGFFVVSWISLYSYLSGSKTSIIIFLLILIIPKHYDLIFVSKSKNKNLFYITIIIFSIILWPLITLQTHIRFTSNLFEMQDAFFDYISRNPQSILPIYSGEFVGCSDTFATIIEKIKSGTIFFNYGERWIKDLISFLPNFLMKDRPLSSPNYFISLLYPDIREGAGLGWFILTDGYWAFGLPGVALISIVFGYFLRINYDIICSIYQNSFVLALFQNLYFISVLTSIRTGFFGTIKMFMINLFLLLFLSFLYKSFPKKNELKNNV